MSRLLIADDHPLYRTVLAEAVRTQLPDARIPPPQTYATTRDSFKMSRRLR